MASFSTYIPLLLNVEGGFQNHPEDQGNYNSLGELIGTNHGISTRLYEKIIGRPPKECDIKCITKQEAISIYKNEFWNKLRADEINSQAVANTVVDHHVNSGRGVILAQQVLNQNFGFELTKDNILGNNTLNALNTISEIKFVKEYNSAREDFYKALNNNTAFINGWINRIKKFAINNSESISVMALVMALSTFFLS
ncbi:glycoside hydrolase family 108 protein [Flavobacteriaceae bacterium 14752]|uniref:glycoside hydrolase family 108 protein n=1 Tax=Mesohalobacter salilacus TaxID=2491711 RepID=UPI000F63B75C|nr:hypothetical protein EIG84_05900 [Flavobacteriaceae bacterium 14752]